MFYLVYNKIQNDPTKDFSLNQDNYKKESGYRCNGSGDKSRECSALKFFHGVVWSSNTLTAQIYIRSGMLDTIENNNIMLLSLNNFTRAYKHMNNKPFMKVYIDKNAYLKTEFTLISGGTISATTPKPIPFDEPVYIQANEHGENYEVDWKSLKTGESSIGKASHQFPPEDHTTDGNIQKTIVENIYIKHLEFANDKLFMSGYTWSTFIPMFSLDNNITSNIIMYQGNGLNIDGEFINKIISDITQNTNHFKEKDLRVYIDDNSNVEAIDIRQY